jgi:quinol monooxygenase YgiN
MSISLIVSGAGAVVAAAGLVMLLVRCARAPRGDLIAWSVALLGLLVSLGAQAVGHAAGFGALTFRAMETGGQVIAPMALIMGLSEAVARSMPGRFAGRLLIPAFTIIPLAVFGTDPLSGTAFTKAWPPPATYYQLIPNKLLEFGLAPATVIVALVTAGIAIRRSRREFAWRAALIPVLAAAVAVLVLALPGLAPALRDHLGLKLPLSGLFAVLGLAAAALTWYAAIGTASVPIDALRDASLRSGDDRGRYARAPRAGAGRAGAGRAGAGRDGASPLPEAYDPYEEDFGDAAGRGSAGGQGYGRGPYEDDRSRSSYDGGYGREPDSSYDHAAYDSASYDSGPQGGPPDGRSPGTGDARWADVDQTGDLEAYREGMTAAARSREPDSGYFGPRTGDVAATPDPGAPGRAAPDRAAPTPADAGPLAEAGPTGDTRDELFGQIAIYTLIEDTTDEFDRLTERVVTQVRAGEPSTLVYIVHAVPSAPMQRILYEVYRDRSAYEQHLRQPYVSQFETDRRPYVLATNVIELGLQHAKVSPFPSIADLFGEPGYDTSGFERPDFTREYGSTVGRPAPSAVAPGAVAPGEIAPSGVAARGAAGGSRAGRRRADGPGPGGR